MTGSLLTLVGADLVRPSPGWLLTGGRLRKLGPRMARLRDPAGFARLRRVCEDDPGITAGAGAMVQFRLAVIAAAKGGMLADVTVGDVLEVMEAERPLRAKQHAGPATFQVLQQMGIFGPAFRRYGRSAALASGRLRNWSTATRSPAGRSAT